MRIRSITLDNARRFVDAARVGPIGDGITLLCEPNERGKSTLFDALHALMFQKHTASSAQVRALRPHSGGHVAVEAEIELDGAVWRLRKRWFAGKEAKVWQDGRLVHQGGEADDWIAALTGGEDGGPSGLLWVRQGVTGLEHGSTGDRQKAEALRRDLLSSVAGAVDDMTGGRRMDAALSTLRDELSALQTATGQKRKNGPWDRAQARVLELELEEADLAGKAAELAEALSDRRRAAADLDRTRDPKAKARRRADLDTARAAVRAAESHASSVRQADLTAAAAETALKTARAAAKQRADAGAEQADATAARDTARVADDAARQALADATAGRDAAKAALGTADRAATAAAEVLRAVDRRERADRARADREDLTKRIAAAEAALRDAADRRAAARTGPDPRAVDRLDALAAEVALARTARDRAAPRLAFAYAPGAGPPTLDGAALADGASVAVPGGAEIDLPGFGRLSVRVPDTGEDAVATAEAALAEALAKAGVDSPAAARAALDRAVRAGRDAEALAEQAKLWAPDGPDALRDALARLPDPAGDDADLPDRATAETEEAAARAALDAARAAEVRAAAAETAAQAAAATAAADLRGADARLARADAALSDLPEAPADDALDRAEAEATAARAEHARLAAAAPDLDAARARQTRMEAVVDQAARDESDLAQRIARLDALIETRAGEGVEERLAETRDRLHAARAAEARVAFEAAVLDRLVRELEGQRSAARDRYFAPVARKLRPLLDLLWPDATLDWSDGLLPTALVRDGQAEPIDSLSGGTQEQIAFLVRLAFSQLLAEDGRPAPIILDDALVFSDDDRIERMFDALHRIAGETQIIVLSCRQRAFQGLGAPRLTFEPAPPG